MTQEISPNGEIVKSVSASLGSRWMVVVVIVVGGGGSVVVLWQMMTMMCG